MEIPVYRTKHNALCMPTNSNGTFVERRDHGKDYVLAQMLPAAPQRLEWVRKDRLTAVMRNAAAAAVIAALSACASVHVVASDRAFPAHERPPTHQRHSINLTFIRRF